MTRQSKAVQKKIIAKQFTALHLAGQKGPARTVTKHNKVKTFRFLEAEKRAAELVAELAAAERGGKPKGKPNTSGKNSKYAQKRAA